MSEEELREDGLGLWMAWHDEQCVCVCVCVWSVCVGGGCRGRDAVGEGAGGRWVERSHRGGRAAGAREAG